MKRTTIAALALLAGCATPNEVRRDGTRYDYALTQPARQAANCLARNANEYLFGFSASVIEAGPDAYEVVVRQGEFSNVAAVANVTTLGAGSRATIWGNAIPIHGAGLPAAMAKGC